MSTKTIHPKEISVSELHKLLLSAVAPRPIALASTIDAERNVNLSPFSFFNVFSANPPILFFLQHVEVEIIPQNIPMKM